MSDVANHRAGFASRLLVWLVPATILVFGACLFAVLAAARHAIDDAVQSDATSRAEALIALFEVEPDGTVEVEAPWGSDESDEPATALVFVLIRHTDDAELARSAGLDDTGAATLVGADVSPQRYDAAINGRSYRLVTRDFEARREEEAPDGSGPVRCTLYAGVDRAPYDAQYAAIVRRTVPLMLGGLLALLGIAVLIVRLGVRPLDRLARDVRGQRDDALRPVDVQAPREVADVASAFNELVARVEASRERERRFLADASHELRTPLAEVHSIAEVGLRDPALGERVQQDYAEVLEASERMTAMVSAFLTLARCEAGTLVPGVEPVRIDAVTSAAWQTAASRMAERGVHAQEPSLPPVTCVGRAELLSVIVGNLLDNAAEYTPSGGRVAVELEDDGARFALHITNTVADLDATDAERLFERFWRRDGSRTGSHAGLGLSLARAVAEAQGFSLVAAFAPAGSLLPESRVPAGSLLPESHIQDLPESRVQDLPESRVQDLPESHSQLALRMTLAGPTHFSATS